jgi:two-component system sensor histidine kinase KdpD
VLAVLKLAEELGAGTAVLTGEDVAAALVAHAQELNCATVRGGPAACPRLPWGLGGAP